jgi:murein DD-endopeptidase MepM/ murein hydrolase activator NlpD
MVENSSGKCVKKPCVGDPVANVEIAPQLGPSGMQGALHDTCARYNEKYTCKGVRGRKLHDGVDLKNPYGAPVFASYDGIAKEGTQRNIKTGKIKGAGHYVGVISRVNGKKIRLVYFHLQKDRRTKGTIKAGDIIGYQGDSGNLESAIERGYATSHVHVKAQENGKSDEPLDHFKTKINPKTGELINPCN